MGIFDYFKKKSEEKRKKREEERKNRLDAELNKLAPYEKEINNNRDLTRHLAPWSIWEKVENELKSDPKINLYDKIIELMVTIDDKLIERNVIMIINALNFRSLIEKQHGSEIKSKIIEKKAWIGMTESMFKDSLMYISGTSHLSNYNIVEDEIEDKTMPKPHVGNFKYYNFDTSFFIPPSKKGHPSLSIQKFKFKRVKLNSEFILYEMEDFDTYLQKLLESSE